MYPFSTVPNPVLINSEILCIRYIQKFLYKIWHGDVNRVFREAVILKTSERFKIPRSECF